MNNTQYDKLKYIKSIIEPIESIEDSILCQNLDDVKYTTSEYTSTECNGYIKGTNSTSFIKYVIPLNCPPNYSLKKIGRKMKCVENCRIGFLTTSDDTVCLPDVIIPIPTQYIKNKVDLSCPSDYILQNGKCYKNCKIGYFNSPNGEACIPSINTSYIKNIIESIKDNSVCNVLDDVTYDYGTCKGTISMSDNYKNKKTIIIPTNCPSNYSLNNNGSCYENCKVGYLNSPDGKMCIPITQSIPIPINTEYLKNNIEQIKDINLDIKCPSNYSLNINGWCYENCKVGYLNSLDGKMCIPKDSLIKPNMQGDLQLDNIQAQQLDNNMKSSEIYQTLLTNNNVNKSKVIEGLDKNNEGFTNQSKLSNSIFSWNNILLYLFMILLIYLITANSLFQVYI